MRLTPFGRGLVVLALVLAAFSLFFDDAAAAVAAGGLVVLLFVRAAVFLSSLSATARSLSVTRSVSSRFVRQGAVIEVTTRSDGAVPPSFSASVSDLPPEGAVAAGGSMSGPAGGILRYSIAPLVIGRHSFPGIRLAFSDLFFSDEVTLPAPDGPGLTVFPSSDYALPGKDLYGEAEAPVVSTLPSPGVRSFREYIPGDDPRKIDWKLTARYDTLYVREYMGRADTSHLLVFDLPDVSVPFPPDAFARVREAAVAAVARQPSGPSVLLVSGPNLVAFLPRVADPGRVTAMMQRLAPSPRLHSLYRYARTPVLRRRYERGWPPAAKALLSHRTATSFEVQVAAALSGLSTSTAHVFSLALGDVSHLCLLAEQGRLQGMAVHLHVPEGSVSPRFRARIRGCPFASVEAV